MLGRSFISFDVVHYLYLWRNRVITKGSRQRSLIQRLPLRFLVSMYIFYEQFLFVQVLLVH